MRKTGYIGGLLALAFLMGLTPIVSMKDADASEPATLKVYDPTGAYKVTQPFVPRLTDLNGKTVCELSNDDWESYRTFPVIRELLQRQFPTMKIIPYTEFPTGKDGIDNDKAASLAKQKGCQAAIVGNAG